MGGLFVVGLYLGGTFCREDFLVYNRIFISLPYYMFQSILNTFGFGYFFGGKN